MMNNMEKVYVYGNTIANNKYYKMKLLLVEQIEITKEEYYETKESIGE